MTHSAFSNRAAKFGDGVGDDRLGLVGTAEPNQGDAGITVGDLDVVDVGQLEAPHTCGHERDAFAGRPKNMVVVPVVSSFVWIAAACCCALRRRRQQRRLSGKGV